MKVQAQFSIDHEVLIALKAECRREEIPFSDYIQEAINVFGPVTADSAKIIWRKRGAQRKDEFFDARPKVKDDRLGSES